jgi:hypothetical protein
MCHPWLAAGVTSFIAVLLVRELGPVVREPTSMEARFETGLLGANLRRWFRARIGGLAEAALGYGLTADSATWLQLALSLVCGVSYAYGWMFTAGWILIAFRHTRRPRWRNGSTAAARWSTRGVPRFRRGPVR